MIFNNPRQALTALVTVVVVGAVIAGIAMLDSPTRQRQRKLDARRIEDLIGIQSAINAYWKLRKTLPQDLAALVSEPGFRIETIDPGTGSPYSYEVAGPDEFRLCAIFAMDSNEQPNFGFHAGRLDWAHGPGRHCFDLKVAKPN